MRKGTYNGAANNMHARDIMSVMSGQFSFGTRVNNLSGSIEQLGIISLFGSNCRLSYGKQ